jgi:hypothetical protein
MGARLALGSPRGDGCDQRICPRTLRTGGASLAYRGRRLSELPFGRPSRPRACGWCRLGDHSRSLWVCGRQWMRCARRRVGRHGRGGRGDGGRGGRSGRGGGGSGGGGGGGHSGNTSGEHVVDEVELAFRSERRGTERRIGHSGSPFTLGARYGALASSLTCVSGLTSLTTQGNRRLYLRAPHRPFSGRCRLQRCRSSRTVAA